MQPKMIEEKIGIEGFPADFERHLAADEGKAATQLLFCKLVGVNLCKLFGVRG
jgi:hypothetical protein